MVMTSNTGLDTWNLISGAIGVVTVLPFIWAVVYNQHPETKLAHLESTLKDTEVLLHSIVEEGLLHHEYHVPHFESNLTMLRNKAEALREETFIASIQWRRLLQAWFNGLSRRIDTLCKQVKAVRANICETSVDARIRLRQEHVDEVLLVHRGWRAKVATFWGCIVLFVGRKPSIETPDSQGTTTPALLTSHDIIPSTVDTTIPTLEGRACNDTCLSPPPLRKASMRPQNPRAGRVSDRMSSTASRTRDLHVLSRAIRRVNRELAAQGVTNALLTQLAQATHKQWSPASSKAHPPRRSRKPHRPVPRPDHISTTQRASHPGAESDIDSSGEETMCEV